MPERTRNAVIIYCSQTGFTQRYAEWLAEDLECTAIPFAKRPEADLAHADVLVFCSWFHAASLKGSKWLKGIMQEHPELTIIVLCTGATPMLHDMQPPAEFEEAFARAFPPSAYPDLAHFYCQGGFDFDRLGVPDKIAMKMFFKVKEGEAKEDPKAAEMLRVMKAGFDGTNRAYLKPVRKYLDEHEALQ